jgi:CHAD domain-containing protein
MTITSMIETERKYEVDESTTIPDLSELGSVLFEDPVTLRAVYYDTPDGALAAHLFTLRRRTGGKDEGWHLKRPAQGGRTEHHAPLATDASDTTERPPADLVDLVRAVVRDRGLVEVARLTTERTIVHLLGPDGQPVAEIADDMVSASDVHTGILRIWREWEAELLDAAPQGEKKRTALLNAIEDKLLAAGAAPSRSASKLAQATGRTSLAPVRTGMAPRPLGKWSTSLEVVSAILSDLTTALIAADPRVRVDEPDAVHAMRTIVRRLRAVLAAFRPVLDRAVVDGVRDRLQQFGSVLGAARDAEVRRERAELLLDAGKDRGAERGLTGDSAVDVAQPDTDLQRRLVDDAVGEYGARLMELFDYLNSAEYFSLLDDLELLVSRPPVTGLSMLPAKEEMRTALRRESRRARRRLQDADPTDLTSLHEARKAARRLRYVAEALSGSVAPIFGKRARALADSAQAVQEVIGEHRDALLFVERLDVTAREATEAGENAFGYGVLALAERRNATVALDRLHPVIDDLEKASKA